MQEVRAAVIGTGVMGRKYAQMIAEGKAGALRLTAVVCRSAGVRTGAAGQGFCARPGGRLAGAERQPRRHDLKAHCQSAGSDHRDR